MAECSVSTIKTSMPDPAITSATNGSGTVTKAAPATAASRKVFNSALLRMGYPVPPDQA